MNDIYEVRDFRPSDFNFIKATFLRGVYYGNEFYNLMSKDVFMRAYSPIAEALITRNPVKVACLREDPDVLLGYTIVSSDNTTVHWVYVKQAFRKQGISKDLIPNSIDTYTHFSTLGLALARKMSLNFNPFQL